MHFLTPKQSFVNGEHASFSETRNVFLYQLGAQEAAGTQASKHSASIFGGACDPWDLGVVGWLL